MKNLRNLKAIKFMAALSVAVAVMAGDAQGASRPRRGKVGAVVNAFNNAASVAKQSPRARRAGASMTRAQAAAIAKNEALHPTDPEEIMKKNRAEAAKRQHEARQEKFAERRMSTSMKVFGGVCAGLALMSGVGVHQMYQRYNEPQFAATPGTEYCCEGDACPVAGAGCAPCPPKAPAAGSAGTCAPGTAGCTDTAMPGPGDAAAPLDPASRVVQCMAGSSLMDGICRAVVHVVADKPMATPVATPVPTASPAPAPMPTASPVPTATPAIDARFERIETGIGEIKDMLRADAPVSCSHQVPHSVRGALELFTGKVFELGRKATGTTGTTYCWSK